MRWRASRAAIRPGPQPMSSTRSSGLEAAGVDQPDLEEPPPGRGELARQPEPPGRDERVAPAGHPITQVEAGAEGPAGRPGE